MKRGVPRNSPAAVSCVARLELRDAEVHDLRLARGQHHDVGGLDVAMDDALARGRGARASATRATIRSASRQSSRAPSASSPRGSAPAGARGRCRGCRSRDRVRRRARPRCRDGRAAPRCGPPPGSAARSSRVSASVTAKRRRIVLRAIVPAQGGVVGFVDDAHHAPAELAADLVAADRLGDAFLSHGLGGRDSIATAPCPGEARAGQGTVLLGSADEARAAPCGSPRAAGSPPAPSRP